MNDLIGIRFGQLLVIDVEKNEYRDKNGIKIKRWECLCDCGKTIYYPTAVVKNKKSCGHDRYKNAADVCRRNFKQDLKTRLFKYRSIQDMGYISECWIWIGLSKGGYGCITADGKTTTSHRVSYKAFNGDIQKGLEVCHLCHNRLCFNPDHLVLGTHKQNMEMSSGTGVMSTGKKITEEIARQVKNKLKNGESNKHIATLLEIPYTIVVDIKRGKTWNHV